MRAIFFSGVLIVTLIACAKSVAPVVLFSHREPISGPLYLVAAKEKEVVRASLRRAGIELTEDLAEAGAMLRVTLGMGQSRKSCGEFSNVKYSVRKNQVQLFQVSGAGWSGTCEPLVYDAMNALLDRTLKGIER